ncbi:MAG: hypothetical protein JXB32_11645 [Deltaproteobacteria bacterium]|nr:hypothetical protein [Deltaproteobacteria bacterium]
MWFDPRVPADAARVPDPFEQDPDSPRDWDDAPVLLPTPGYAFSAVLPHPDGRRALAVRHDLRDGPEQSESSLVAVDPSTLEVETLWSPGGRLLLLGRVGERAVVLRLGESDAQVVAVDADGGGEIASDRIRLREEESPPMRLLRQVQDGRPPLAGPLGANGFAFHCDDETICVATVSRNAIRVRKRSWSGDWELWVFPGGTMVEGDDGWIAVGDLPSASVVESSEDEFAWQDALTNGLPVDGRVTDGIHAAVLAERVRPWIRLPELPAAGEADGRDLPDDIQGEGPVRTGVAVFSGWIARLWPSQEYELFADALVAGGTLAVGFGSSGEGPPARPDFVVALDPERTAAHVVEVGGTSAVRVELRTNITVSVLSDGVESEECWIGWLVLRSANRGVEYDGGEGLAYIPAQFGWCD